MRALLASLLLALPAAAQTPGLHVVEYASSVDQELLGAKLWIPPGYEPDGPPAPLFVYLHGGGAAGSFPAGMTLELNARGWIGLAPDGREWGLDEDGCPWELSAAYVDSADPRVGPGERDILDALDWAEASLAADRERVYLTGFSMGGRGAYVIGLKHPDRFAALGPMAPMIDPIEHYTRRPEPCACFEGITGGAPGDGPLVDTMYKLTAARFLIENAIALPVFHAHGSDDVVVPNALALAPFQQGWHLTLDPAFDACHATPGDTASWGNGCYLGDGSELPLAFCAGHTPTLAELAARHPDGYTFAHLFTPHGHAQRPEWLVGAPAAPGWYGVETAPGSGELLGLFEFLDGRQRAQAPATVVYKSYTDVDRRAWWLELDSAAPWTSLPAAVRATREPASNALHLELARAAGLSVDLARAELALAPGAPLELLVERLDEPVFDPALASPGEALEPTVALRGELDAVLGAHVLAGDEPLDAALVLLSDEELRIGPLPVLGPTTLTVIADGIYCEASPNSAGPGALLGFRGSTSVAANDLVLDATGGVPGQPALFFYGSPTPPAPFGEGTLCAGPPSYRFEPALALSSEGAASLPVDNSLPPADTGPGALAPGATFGFQVWYRDAAGGPSAFNLSAALSLTFVP